MIQLSDITPIGLFSKTHGIKGELNVMIEDDAEIINHCKCIIISIEGIFVPHFLTSIRQKGTQSKLITIENIDSEEEAKPFVGKTIYILKRDYNSYYDQEENEEGGYASDFIGYTIVDDDIGEIGEIIEIETSTDNALFIIQNDDKIYYIPITEDFITEIDDENNTIFMRLPDGILDL